MGFTVLGLGPNSLKEGCIGEYLAAEPTLNPYLET